MIEKANEKGILKVKLEHGHLRGEIREVHKRDWRENDGQLDTMNRLIEVSARFRQIDEIAKMLGIQVETPPPTPRKKKKKKGGGKYSDSEEEMSMSFSEMSSEPTRKKKKGGVGKKKGGKRK